MKQKINTTDEYLLREIGEKLARVRLEKNMTQEQLAQNAGISKRTLSRIESGSGASHMTAFIRVCRQLGLLDRFLAIVPDPVPSPMEQLKMRGRQRQRASGSRLKTNHRAKYPEVGDSGNAFMVAEDPPQWKWGDEK